jgi:hypothetical protein
MCSISKFIGDFNHVNRLISWLSNFYSGNRSIRFASIIARSGNGKTFLVELLALDFNVELFHIIPERVICEDDIFNYIKSLNLAPLDGRLKLILIDDIDEFYGLRKKFQKALIDFKDTAIYPIIYTSKKKLEFMDRKNAITVYLKKPTSGELYNLLKEKNTKGYSDDRLKEIAEKSPSVRSAIHSLYSSDVEDIATPFKTDEEIIYDIKYRQLDRPLNRRLNTLLFNSIKGFDADAYVVMKRIADFDFRLCCYHKNIDHFEVNNTLEPMEKVLEYQGYRKRKVGE